MEVPFQHEYAAVSETRIYLLNGADSATGCVCSGNKGTNNVYLNGRVTYTASVNLSPDEEAVTATEAYIIIAHSVCDDRRA